MANVIPLEDPTDYKRLFHQIKKLWNDGYIEIVPHAQERMQERGLDINDLRHVIRYGRLTGHRWEKGSWRYTIQGTSVDGLEARCVVEIKGNLIIVTVICDR